ncbi:MAG: uroporphyrinogen methyltransferase / synthase [Petroclostridium sp.]|uniref:uroporphyrinogen-III C-methyltransferase n=1 Tax=Petroclostridium xylanilyticum TaxID=1792311 RepID=UPI000B997389|nr:uroporphyrinogen-III C-methyltransferase [Petroclostridium xylanilyticum]MBZ4646438.1 cobA 1 [Clostridia bacterium]MDK2811231.1 uroporphyrinogen methyltransferase / synthase [Petroclostridium sp.]
MEKGKVYLVGAGPGDYKLITLRALELIQKADVLVYDRLVNKKILKYRSKSCELVYVGKEPDHHTLTQDEINDVLIQKAQEGKNVVRLKGGDPFIFGRGGEEAEYIRQHGLEFEIVPGISSFYSCPAYAGIPVTHREFSTSVHVITGHEEEGKEDVDYPTLAKLEGTLVFLMGMKNIGMISQKLIENGKRPDTPAAVIHWGTTSRQRTVTAALEDIEKVVRENNITSPSVLVIGNVVTLQKKLDWLSSRPLFGKRILVTRTSAQAGTLADKIEMLGGDVVEFPTINITKPVDYRPLDEALNNIHMYSWIVFTSVNGVEGFFTRMKELKIDIRKLAGIKIFSIGPKTKEKIEELGLNIDIIPEQFNSYGAEKVIKEHIHEKDRVLIPTSNIGRETIYNIIAEKGATVHKVEAYRTQPNDEIDLEVLEDLRKGDIDIITFASSSAVENFVKIVGTDIGQTKVCSIGPVTTETANSLGLGVAGTASNATIDELVNCVLKVCGVK